MRHRTYPLDPCERLSHRAHVTAVTSDDGQKVQRRERIGVVVERQPSVPARLLSGILAHRFARLRCSDCGHERLRPFLETNPDIAGAVLRIFVRAVRTRYIQLLEDELRRFNELVEQLGLPAVVLPRRGRLVN